MTAPDLRPLSFGELLDGIFTYYRRHFWLLVGIAAIPQAATTAVTVLQQGIIESVQAQAPVSPAFAGLFVLGSTVLLLLVSFLMNSLAYGAMAVAASRIHLNQPVTVREAYRALKGCLWRLLDVVLSVAFRAFGCVITIILAPLAVLVFLWYAFAVPLVVIEKLNAGRALKRSRQLTQGYLGRIFLLGLLMVMISWTVIGIAQGPFYVVMIILAMKQIQPPYWLMMLMSVSAGAAGALTAPLLMVGLVLVYYDSRVTKEGYDVQALLEALPAESGPAGALPVQDTRDEEEKLEPTSVPLVVLLGLVTFGVYIPIWILNRRKALNTLRSTEKLSPWTLGGILAAFLAYFGTSLSTGLAQTTPVPDWVQPVEVAGRLTLFAAGLALLFQLFKVRRILMDHFVVESSGPFSSTISLQSEAQLSGLATFFLGIYYLQYKINRLLELNVPWASS